MIDKIYNDSSKPNFHYMSPKIKHINNSRFFSQNRYGGAPESTRHSRNSSLNNFLSTYMGTLKNKQKQDQSILNVPATDIFGVHQSSYFTKQPSIMNKDLSLPGKDLMKKEKRQGYLTKQNSNK